MSDSEDSNFSEDESERSSEAEEVEENEVRLMGGKKASGHALSAHGITVSLNTSENLWESQWAST